MSDWTRFLPEAAAPRLAKAATTPNWTRFLPPDDGPGLEAPVVQEPPSLLSRMASGAGSVAHGVGDVVSLPFRGLGMLATGIQEELADTPAEHSRLGVRAGASAWDRALGVDSTAPTPAQLALEGYKLIPQAIEGVADISQGGALREEDPLIRKAWENENRGLARTEAVAEPIGEMAMMFGSDPALAALGGLSKLANSGRLTRKAIDAGHMLGADTALTAAAERSMQVGGYADKAGRLIGASFVPGMVEGAYEGGKEFLRAGAEQGYASPDALRAGVGALTSGAMAAFTGLHAAGPAHTVSDVRPTGKSLRDPARPMGEREHAELSTELDAKTRLEHAAERATVAEELGIPASDPRVSRAIEARAAQRVGFSDEPAPLEFPKDEPELTLDEPAPFEFPKDKEPDVDPAQVIPTDLAPEVQTPTDLSPMSSAEQFGQREFLRPDAEAGANAEQARLVRKHLAEKFELEREPERVGQAIVDAGEDFDPIMAEQSRLERAAKEADLALLDENAAAGGPGLRDVAAREAQKAAVEQEAVRAQDAERAAFDAAAAAERATSGLASQRDAAVRRAQEEATQRAGLEAQAAEKAAFDQARELERQAAAEQQPAPPPEPAPAVTPSPATGASTTAQEPLETKVAAPEPTFPVARKATPLAGDSGVGGEVPIRSTADLLGMGGEAERIADPVKLRQSIAERYPGLPAEAVEMIAKAEEDRVSLPRAEQRTSGDRRAADPLRPESDRRGTQESVGEAEDAPIEESLDVEDRAEFEQRVTERHAKIETKSPHLAGEAAARISRAEERAIEADRWDVQTGVRSKNEWHRRQRAMASGKIPKVPAYSEVDLMGATETNKLGDDFTDARLHVLAQTLKKFVGKNGKVFRKGGDEFAIEWNDARVGQEMHSGLAKQLNGAHVVVRRGGQIAAEWEGVGHHEGFGLGEFHNATQALNDAKGASGAKPKELSPEMRARIQQGRLNDRVPLPGGSELRGDQAGGGGVPGEKTGDVRPADPELAPKPGEASTTKHATAPADADKAPAIDTPAVKRAFPTSKITPTEEGFLVSLPGGQEIRVNPVGEIEYNAASFKAGYGRGKSGEEKLVGSWQRLPRGGIIQLAKEGATDATLLHESFHAAMDLALSPKEKAAVIRAYGSEEKAADAYGKWKPQVPHSAFGKIRQFFQRIYRSFVPSGESVFGDVRSGKAFERGPETGQMREAFAAAAQAVGDRVENFKRWFGKSKAVDEHGAPRKLYHGTATDPAGPFTVFRGGEGVPSDRTGFGSGIYLTEAADMAATYSERTALKRPLDNRALVAEFRRINKKAIAALDADDRSHVREILGYAEKDLAYMERPRPASWPPDVGGMLGDGARNTSSVKQRLRELERLGLKLPQDEGAQVMSLYAKIENPIDMDQALPDGGKAFFDRAKRVSPPELHAGLDAAASKTMSYARMADREVPTHADAWHAMRALGFAGADDVGRSVLQRMGYDGITHLDTANSSGMQGTAPAPHRVWVAWEPTQVKSTIGNRGTFDPKNPDIRFAAAAKAVGDRVENFKRWFAGSQVVDRQGAPLKVFHGTPRSGFNVFDKARQGKNTDSGFYGKGFYFTNRTDYTAEYSGELNGAGVLPVYLDMKKPFIIDRNGHHLREAMAAAKELGIELGGGRIKHPAKFTAALKRAGYDGVIWRDSFFHEESSFRRPNEYVVFEPTQIKSAIGNSGAFDPKNPDIRYATKDGWSTPKKEKPVEKAKDGLPVYRDERSIRAVSAPEVIATMGKDAHPTRRFHIELLPDGVSIYDKAPREHIGYMDSVNDGSALSAVERLIKKGVLPEEASIWDPEDPTMSRAIDIDAKEVLLEARQIEGPKYATAPAEPPATSKIKPIAEKPREEREPVLGKEGRAAAIRAANAGGEDVPSGKPPDEFINYDRVNTDKDVKAMQGRIVDALTKQLGAAKGYRSWGEAREKALLSGMSEKDFVRMMQDGGGVTDHVIEAGRMMREESAKRAKDGIDAAQKLRNEGADETKILEAEREADAAAALHAAVTWGTVRAGAEAGRALAIHRKLSEGLTPSERFFKRALKEVPLMTAEQRTALAKAVLKGDSAEIAKVAREAFKPSVMDKFLEYWKAGLVSGPATIGGNFMSNTLFEAWRTIERGGAGAIDAAYSKVTGAERTRYAGEALKALSSMHTSVPRAMSIFWDVLKDPRTDFDINSEARVEHAVPKIGKGYIPGVDAGAVIRTPFRILKAFDEAAKHIAGQNELFAQSYRLAKMEGGGNTDVRMAELVKSHGEYHDAMMAKRAGAKLSDEQRSALTHPQSQRIAAAVDKARLEATFQDEAGKWTQGVLLMRGTNPLWQLILPFVKTPARILSAGLERTPIGFAKAWKGIHEGKIKGRGEAADALIKPMIGTMLGIGFVAAAKDGLITGSGPADPKERKLKLATGWQPYSIKVGGSFYSMRRLEPLATTLGLAADLVEASEEDRGKIGEKIQAAIVDNITSKSYLQGVANFGELLADPKRYGPTFLKNLEGSLVPNIVKKGAEAIDPTVRDTSSLAGPIAARIPGLSKTLPAKRDATGEGIERPGTALERFASPLARSAEKDAPLERELLDIDYSPSAPSKTLPLPGTAGKVKLELTEAEYAIMQDYDKQASDRVRKAMKAPGYRAMAPEARQKYVRRLYDQAGSAAKAKVTQTPAFRQRAKERYAQFKARA